MANRSVVQPSSAEVVPAGILPGHQAIVGSRMPPSQVLPLPPRSRPAEPPCWLLISHGPLSLVKNTSVLLVELQLAQRVEHLADAPVELLDHVAIQAAAALALELLGSEQRHVRKVVRQVEEERPVAVLRG